MDTLRRLSSYLSHNNSNSHRVVGGNELSIWANLPPEVLCQIFTWLGKLIKTTNQILKTKCQTRIYARYSQYFKSL